MANIKNVTKINLLGLGSTRISVNQEDLVFGDKRDVDAVDIPNEVIIHAYENIKASLHVKGEYQQLPFTLSVVENDTGTYFKCGSVMLGRVYYDARVEKPWICEIGCDNGHKNSDYSFTNKNFALIFMSEKLKINY